MPETKIERTTFWMDRELVKLARKVAAMEERKTFTEIVEEELWRSLRRRYSRALDKANAELGEAGA